MISKYNAMWILVAFDLPTLTKKQRRIASNFREQLKKSGFVILQKSIYSYYACTKDRCDTIANTIKRLVPDDGHIAILFLTDRMFGLTKNYYGKKTSKLKQPELFDELL